MAKIHATLVKKDYELYMDAIKDYCTDEYINYFVSPEKEEVVIFQDFEELLKRIDDYVESRNSFYDSIMPIEINAVMNYTIAQDFFATEKSAESDDYYPTFG